MKMSNNKIINSKNLIFFYFTPSNCFLNRNLLERKRKNRIILNSENFSKRLFKNNDSEFKIFDSVNTNFDFMSN